MSSFSTTALGVGTEADDFPIIQPGTMLLAEAGGAQYPFVVPGDDRDEPTLQSLGKWLWRVRYWNFSISHSAGYSWTSQMLPYANAVDAVAQSNPISDEEQMLFKDTASGTLDRLWYVSLANPSPDIINIKCKLGIASRELADAEFAAVAPVSDYRDLCKRITDADGNRFAPRITVKASLQIPDVVITAFSETGGTDQATIEFDSMQMPVVSSTDDLDGITTVNIWPGGYWSWDGKFNTLTGELN